jgi:hypothetical protein
MKKNKQYYSNSKIYNMSKNKTKYYIICSAMALLILSSCEKTFPGNQINTSNTSGADSIPRAQLPSSNQTSVNPFRNATRVGNLSIARADMASAICNNRFFFAGGYDSQNQTRSDIDIFDPVTNTISQAKLSIARNEITGIGTSTKVFFAGGFYSGGWGEPSSRVDMYDALSNSWTTTELSIPRHHMGVGVVGNKVFFAGGITNYSLFTSVVDIYDLTTNTWSTKSLSEPRGDLAAAVVGNKILFAGGRTNKGKGSSTRVDIFDIATNTWTRAELSSPKIGLTSITFNDKAYFTGSDYGVMGSNVDVYDSPTNSWSTLKLTEGKVWIPIGSSNNKIAFIGGMLGWFNHSKLIEIYDPVLNKFSQSYMNNDLMWESVISYGDHIYSAGGAISEGDIPIPGIFKFQL